MSRLDWQIGGDAERGRLDGRSTKFMVVRHGVEEDTSSVRKGNLSGFFDAHNASQGWQHGRNRSLAGVGGAIEAYNPDSMAHQFRDTRGANYCSDEYAGWKTGVDEHEPEEDFWGVGDHPTWGKSEATVFAPQTTYRTADHTMMPSIQDAPRLPQLGDYRVAQAPVDGAMSRGMMLSDGAYGPRDTWSR